MQRKNKSLLSIAMVVMLLVINCGCIEDGTTGDNSITIKGKDGFYSTIMDAINESSEGDTILVDNGIYNETLIINKSIKLIGNNKDTTIISGNKTGDVIYVTAPIWTSLLIGYLLKKRTKKPLVVDFRDPWTINPYHKPPTKLHAKIENCLERRVLMIADYVVTVSQPYKCRLVAKYPFLKTKSEVIMNGFDPDDFKNLKRQPPQGKFRIVHTGSLYGLRSPKYFLFALHMLIQEKPYLRKQVEVQFVGNYGKEAPMIVDKLGVNDLVQFIAYMPHGKCLELMLNSHILLLIVASEGLKTSGIVTGKLFEYLFSGRPVLALASKESIVANIVQSAKAGLVVSSNVEAIKDAILELYEQWAEGKLSATTEMASIEKYNRKVLTRKLVQIFEKVSQ